MSKKLSRKALALGTALAFGLTGLSAITAAPAMAAEKLVTITPDNGSSQNGQIGYQFDLDIYADDQAPNYDYTMVKVENPSEAAIYFDDEDEVYVLKAGKLVYASSKNVTLDGSTYETYSDSTLYVDTDYESSDIEFDLEVIEETGDFDLTLTAWQDKKNDGLVGDIEASSVSAPFKMHFYDPASLNAVVQLTGTSYDWDTTLEAEDYEADFTANFSQDVNVDYIDYSNFGVVAFVNGEYAELDTYDYSTGTDLGSTDFEFEEFYSNDDDANVIYGTIDLNSYLDEGDKIQLRPLYDNVLDTDKYEWAGTKSPSFTIENVADSTDDDVTDIEISVADSSDSDVDSSNYIRAGVKNIDYTLQLKSVTGDLERAGLPVRVYLGYYDANSDALTLNGDNPAGAPTAQLVGAKTRPVVDGDWQSTVLTGKTNSDGQFTFTVSTTNADEGTYFYLDYGYIDEDGYYVSEDDDADSFYDEYPEYFEYDAAEPDSASFEATSSILAGATATAKFTVEDQFGEPISVDANGKTLKVQIEDESDDTLLKKSVNVVNGVATISFSNYLDKGDQSSLNATLYSGASATSGYIADVSVELYNPEAAGSITVDEEIDGEITYDDFVTGDPTKDDDDDTVAPSIDNMETITGSVDDISGAALPAAVVTLSAKGVQFQEVDSTGTASDEYFKDSITVVAASDGSFEVNVWAHEVNEDGIVITTTSGGKSAKTSFVTDWNQSITDADFAEELALSWNAPKHPAINRTYVVTTTVSDVWGNVLEDAELNYSAGGALEVNGTDSVEGKTTNASGKSTVYVRSVVDADGFAELTAKLVAVDNGVNTLDEDELKDADWSNIISTEVMVGKSAAAKAGKVAGRLIANVYNSAGKTATVYVGGKLKETRTVVGSNFKFAINGLAAGSKKVTVKISGKTYFVDYLTIK